MIRSALTLAAALLSLYPQAAPAQAASPQTSASAHIAEPPNPSKLHLIRRFMQLTGLQRRLDTGSFLERYAIPGGPMWQSPRAGSQDGVTFLQLLERRIAALDRAYARHRATYQRDYENHINWEFTEAELEEIVAFLSRPAGQHYLDGSWRMEAYVGTSVEELEEQIVREAVSSMPN